MKITITSADLDAAIAHDWSNTHRIINHCIFAEALRRATKASYVSCAHTNAVCDAMKVVVLPQHQKPLQQLIACFDEQFGNGGNKERQPIEELLPLTVEVVEGIEVTPC